MANGLVPTGIFTMSSDEVLTAAANKARFIAPCDGKILAVKACSLSAPAGSSIILDVNKGGTTIFTTQANRPTIAAAATTATLAGDPEIVDFADKHAGVMYMSKQNINPYKIGIELMRDIEYRWNRGMFGKDYNECTDMREKLNWDTKLGKGREKIFDVRKSHNDISFIDEFLTPEFCERQQLFTYKYNPRSGRFEIDSKDFLAIKQKLLSQLTNFGQPIIEVEDGNYLNRKELLLSHVHYGVDLDVGFANETLRNLFAIWKRPVNLKTKYEEKEVVFHFDGKDFKTNH